MSRVRLWCDNARGEMLEEYERGVQNTTCSRVFYTFLEYSPSISQVLYHTINAQDEFFYFFYNIKTLFHRKHYFQTD